MEKSTLLSRKFILSLIVVLSISVSFWLGKISEELYIYGLAGAVAIYTGANVLLKKNIDKDGK